jgi:hypothetical protein
MLKAALTDGTMLKAALTHGTYQVGGPESASGARSGPDRGEDFGPAAILARPAETEAIAELRSRPATSVPRVSARQRVRDKTALTRRVCDNGCVTRPRSPNVCVTTRARQRVRDNVS